ncbi:uroporphyrinogen-III synthase [Nephila pilipes]|uniref:Uroporphyrinogen-III synthase n=1 Tax=Nephila pilipes TaxID=299642 RepID=A0A8X6U2J4_NEPPI|nr:uroporphyrinogen-III synthase [Nephila pilipes]
MAFGNVETSRAKVLLLKSEDSDEEVDPYVKILENAGIPASLIPVFDFHYLNDLLLLECMKFPNQYNGIIFTSPRAVKAIKRVYELYGLELQIWREKNNFALGDKTSMLAETLLNLNVLGKQCANSQELAELILSCDGLQKDLPFIFPCSDRAKNIIQNNLEEDDFTVTRVECYQLLPNFNIEDNFMTLITEKGIPDILVYFSPSGVEFSHDIIKKGCGTSQPQVVAVGETTASAVKQANMKLCKVAESPNPKGILNAVKSLL